MREFEHHITDFSTGLRRFKNGPLGSLNLVRCLGFEVKNKAIEVLDQVKNPISVELDWPFPKYFFLSQCTLYVTKNQVFEVDQNWIPRLVLSLPPCSGYSFADFGPFVVGATSTGVVFQRNPDGTWEESTSLPSMTYVTNFRGQIVGASGRKVIWSAIGRADFTLDGSNEAGNFVAPWNCDIIAIQPLGDALLVFGQLGVLEIKPVTDPMPTFAVSEIADFGLANPYAVCSNGNLLLFVDLRGNLWGMDSRTDTANVIRTKVKPVELGYREFFDTFDKENLSITYDSVLAKFFISDGEECFVFSNGALIEARQLVTSSQNGFGICTTVSGPNMIVTDSIDYNVRGLKTINWIELGLETDGEVKLALFWRSSFHDPFKATQWTKLNQRGQVFLRTTALDFRLGIQVADMTHFRLDRITTRLQLSDKRSQRGTVNVGQITS